MSRRALKESHPPVDPAIDSWENRRHPDRADRQQPLLATIWKPGGNLAEIWRGISRARMRALLRLSE